jgi:long-chain acyl-CoA synthetase
VGFRLGNGLPWVACDLACIEARVSAVPIPTFFTAAQTAHVLADAQVNVFITDREVPDSGNWELLVTPPGLSGRCYRHKNRAALASVAPGKVTYTSGSTGQPKGVCLDQTTVDAVVASIVAALAGIDISTHLCILPLATLLENVAGIYAPLMKGITVVVPDASITGLSGSSRLDIQVLGAALERFRPDSIILVPQLLLAITTMTELGMISPTYLKMIAVGGSHVSRQLLERAEALRLPVFEGYGLSECCSVLALNLPGRYRPGSVGKLLPHARLRVSDSGELEAGGALMTGYLGMRPLGEEWLPTGDIGEIDKDGFVYLKGRIKNAFITAYGRNIHPEWVEAELTLNMEIAQALLYGEGRDRNVALVWRRFPGDRETISNIVEAVNTRLPDYAQVHEFILIDEELDRALVTDNGRLKRASVIDKYRALIDEHYWHRQAGVISAIF